MDGWMLQRGVGVYYVRVGAYGVGLDLVIMNSMASLMYVWSCFGKFIRACFSEELGLWD